MLKRFWMTMLVLLASTQALAAPTVSLTAPAANSSYTSPATITLAADAASSEGTIVQVAFYHGQALIGSTSSAPYTLDWPQVSAGTYQLTAVATDSLNASTTSAPVTVSAAAPAQQVYYIHSDHLNTPRLITDANNNAIWQWDSDPFGTTVANEDPGQTGTPFTFNPRFPGQYFDRETGLHYNYFRDYDPQTGRYIQSDPIGLDGGLNTYTYVMGNPVLFTDPTGLICIYSQSTGAFTCINDQGQTYYQANGYAGTGTGRNNPDAQGQQNIGPLPRGRWQITGDWYNSPNTGRNTIRLTPLNGNECSGTGRDCSSFRIHGNNSRNDASHGCIILPPNRTNIPSGEIIEVIK